MQEIYCLRDSGIREERRIANGATTPVGFLCKRNNIAGKAYASQSRLVKNQISAGLAAGETEVLDLAKYEALT